MIKAINHAVGSKIPFIVRHEITVDRFNETRYRSNVNYVSATTYPDVICTYGVELINIDVAVQLYNRPASPRKADVE